MKLDHVGIAVRSLEQAIQTYADQLGFNLGEIVTIPDQGVKVAVFPCGESRIELLEPTNSDSPIHRFLEKKGEGIHHLCFKVDDIESMLAQLKSTPIKPLGDTPCLGLENRKISFLHPKSTHGVLIELVEEKD
jgi:methylmalonyl-CoA epimerase